MAKKVTKYVYFFGNGKAEGTSSMKDLLGGKGANLAEMTNIGLPVPPGFTISTEAYDIPKSLEGYYQETGRAGRDGGEGKCLTYYCHKDLEKLEKFMKDKTPAEKDIGTHLLSETAAYCESSVCRRKMLLHYFGEEYDKDNCGNCDNCLHPKTKTDQKDNLLLALQTIMAVKENFRKEYIINILRGEENETILSHQHQTARVSRACD